MLLIHLGNAYCSFYQLHQLGAGYPLERKSRRRPGNVQLRFENQIERLKIRLDGLNIARQIF